MNTCGRAGFLVLALVACTATDVRAFVLSPAVPATSSTHRSQKSSIFPLATRSTRTTSTTINSSVCTPRARRPGAAGLICRSSPFEDLGYDDDEAARQEAQQLEDMIRGRRGIVLEAVEREWRAEMLKTVEDEGERLCDEAYEGFSTRGRGAIFVNVDMGLSSSNKGHSGAACHAVFRSLEEVVVERSSRVDPNDQMQIIQRCQEYDPEAGFVLVFGHKGMLGVQVMRPSKAPREIHQARRAP